MAEHESSLAVLVDFENMARPGAKGRGDFDIHLVLNRLAEKGRVLVKRAYADWSRYRDARHELQNAGLGLIEMPSAREGAKNRADIQMAVDAMELAYSREHVNNFVIVSGDSDFTPLVGKLRELNKRVIGVGNRESASELLIANCDEFIYYDSLAARAAEGARGRAGASGMNPVELLQETLTALQREGVEWPLASVVKDSMRRKYPAFDESDHGFSTFSKFLEDAGARGLVRLETDPRSGTYRVELADGRVPAPPALAPAADARASEEGEGRRRRRRGRRAEPAPDQAAAPDAGDGAAEVFEVVVTPTPDPDLGTLPPLDQPISYEDMIMLGPEPGDDVPELMEHSDAGAQEPPTRSSRRRRRRGALADPEPTIADLEPREPAEEPAAGDEPAAAPEPEAAEPEAEAVEAEAVEAPAAAVETEAETAEIGSRRRRRRRTVTPAEEAAGTEAEAAAPAEEQPGAEEAPSPPEAPAPPEEEQPAAPSRRRVRRGSTAVAPPAAEEAPAEEEAPAPRRRTRRKAAEPEAPAEAAPAAEGAPAEEEAPAPRRRTRKKAAEPEAPAEAAPAEEEAPAPRRRTRKKAAEPDEVPAA